MHNPTPLNRVLFGLILMVSLITLSGLCFPITSASYSAYYGSIAKHIVETNNWSDLVLTGQDWLDKPHFPFWITALSFKIFGINSFAYIFPGILFHFLGAYYTYKLSFYLYRNSSIALLSTLIYLSVFHLMLSSIDVRAEAYLLGEIIGASFYWLNYDKKFSIRDLGLGALFTALALMTKGPFVIVIIISGLFGLWIYQKRLINLIHPKWWGALALTLLFSIPEYIALYIQFDAHPEKLIFGHTHVSGLRWFFIDSQFGRFFNTGYIMSTNPMPYHQLFFIHTFLWAFLPWTIIYPLAVYSGLKKFNQNIEHERCVLVILLSYFFLGFIMFSLTSFQVDHYTNIIFPYAAILCAKFIYDNHEYSRKIFLIQTYLALLLFVMVAILIGLIFSHKLLMVMISLEIILAIFFIKSWGEPPFLRSIILSVSAISLIFIAIMFANGYIYHQYDVGAVAARYTNLNSKIPVVDYQINSQSLEFYAKNPYFKIYDFDEAKLPKLFYLLSPNSFDLQVKSKFSRISTVAVIKANTNDQVFPYLTNPRRLKLHLKTYNLYLVKLRS